MSNGLAESTIYRKYRCLNCQVIIGCKQLVKDDWLRVCPHCEKEELIIQSGELSVSVLTDINKPKTIGTLSEQNRREKERRGDTDIDKRKADKPWWRKDKKINYDVLKNPTEYIQTGDV